MSNELRLHVQTLMDLREARSVRHDDTSDASGEVDASDSYSARFTELLSIFMPEEETFTELAHH